jgi:transcriptional regulator with XRE-family HTH domain
MNQPDLGLKVTELRQQKGLTQEQLAERCEVSPRTIQRIESGEVDPRAYTLHCLGTVLEFDFGEENTSNENLWLAALHLSSIFVILIIPLLLWSWKKNQSFKIDKQGRQVLNFQITMTLLLFAAAFLLITAPVGLIIAPEQTVHSM